MDDSHDGSVDDLIDWPVVLRYLADECSPAERRRVVTWIGSDVERRAYVDSLRAIDAADLGGAEPFDKTGARAALWMRLGLGADGRARAVPLRASLAQAKLPTIRSGRYWTAIAASVAVLGIGLVAGMSTIHRPASLPLREYATVAGQRLTVTLVDGTRITLGPASRMRLAQGYGQRGRDVILDGEAYFAVVHDARHPFAVQARDVITRDIGTSFDVRAYPEDTTVRVAVADGRVSVRGVDMMAGDVALVTGTDLVMRHGVAVQSLTRWQQGGLVFEGTTLRDAVRDVARAFAINIRVADSTLLTQHITASFGDEPLDNVLSAITIAVGAKYERSGRTVVIRKATTSTDRRREDTHAPIMSTASVMDHGNP